MAAASAASVFSEDQFQCCICLDAFTEPVTIPCGHNFCKKCITQYWHLNVHCRCPMCKKLFAKRPELHVNTVISEMVAKVKQTTTCLEQQRVKPGDVLCDVCAEVKVKALKSCLVCVVSYCEAHLEPHQRIPNLKKHKLTNPMKNLSSRMCRKHEKPLELFCKTDQVCVCRFCVESSHKRHQVVLLKDECEEKKATLGKTEAETEQMIHDRQHKIRELKYSLELSKKDADRETEAGVKVFAKVTQDVEEGLAQLIDVIEKKQSAKDNQTNSFIKELQSEVSQLTRRTSELQQLSRSTDHLEFLQGFASLGAAPPTKDWSEVRVQSSFEGIVKGAVAQLETTLTNEMKKLLAAELKRAQQYAVSVTLDPDTAHPKLVLSADGKRVTHSDSKQNLPEHPERFTSCCAVLGSQSFSSGRFYYEVQVREKTDWTLGVARESVNRKGEIKVCPRNGYWTVWLRNENVYHANNTPPVCLSLTSQPQKVGVFANYEEGVVSFYDVDAEDLIYSYTGCNFKEKLYPYFSPYSNDAGRNAAPLIITPVSDTYLPN